MSGIIDSIKSKVSGSNKGATKETSNTNSEEQQFSIQPHPAKTNDPADLRSNPEQTGGLKNGGGFEAYNARGPYVPSKELMDNVPKPLSREELQARTNELNNN